MTLYIICYKMVCLTHHLFSPVAVNDVDVTEELEEGE